ncbi:MAG: PilN domain-containing protein [Burkholderiaceae bacterium]|jgi:general secretion pathway protein L|nr:PilN domain-containing protein [Burkholderiaceae bacterium]
MSFDRSSLRLFGLDLTRAPGYLRDGWAEALRWPALRWLTPDGPVRLIGADGTESVRAGVSARTLPAAGQVRFVAVELPEALVLRRALVLPRLTEDEVRQAVELDVRTASPFPESDTQWGYAVERGEPLRVEIALTSRRLIERQIEAVRARLGAALPEVWVGGARPFPIPGFGEAARLAHERRMRWALFGLLSLTALLLGALLVTPTLQLRSRALEAVERSEQLARQVKPQVQMRDELGRLGDRLRVLGNATGGRQDVVALIDTITRELPDDVTVSRLEISGSSVKIVGQADNAAQLLQNLGANPAFRDVKAPGGIGRAPTGGKEGFTIELRVGLEGKSP